MTDGENGTGKSQAVGECTQHPETIHFREYNLTSCHFVAPATIQPPNDQHSRPRSRTVEEEICLLDTSLTSGREGDSEGQVGCAECDSGAGRVGDHAEQEGGGGLGGEVVEREKTIYSIDTGRLNQWDYAPFYERDVQHILGQQEDPDLSEVDQDTRRCFNCGSPSHTLSDCPAPRNQPLINLSRQFYTFHQSAHRQALGDLERIHVVEGRRQSRLDWLDWFEPGEVRGTLLREALELDDDESGGEGDGQWLRNMAIWGYPKGWTGERDPRYEVNERVEGEIEQEDEDEPFVIFGDAGEEEEITFSPPHPQSQSPNRNSKISDDDPTPTPPSPPQIHRWASYPTTYFSSALLPIYTGYALPLIPSPCVFTDDRQALWDHITSDNEPPPPSTSPPPLPPPPPHPDVPLPVSEEEQDGEAEMDLSDSD